MFLRVLTSVCLLLVCLMSDQSSGQLTRQLSLSARAVDDVLEKSFEAVSENFDASDFQLEAKERGESESDELADDALDADSLSSAELPAKKLSSQEVEAMLKKSRVISGNTRLAEYNPYVAYSESQLLVSWRCCPRRQGYGCRSYFRKMPCFYHYVNGVRERCCTVWPRNIRYAYCNCNKCAVLTPYCASVGRCQRRYRSQTVWAVCVRQNQAWTLRRLVRSIPTSCYCRTTC